MIIDDKPEFEEVLKRIGQQIELLRTTHTDYNFKQLAKELQVITKNTYLRIERGDGDYTFLNLLSIVRYYPDVKLSDLLRDAGL